MASRITRRMPQTTVSKRRFIRPNTSLEARIPALEAHSPVLEARLDIVETKVNNLKDLVWTLHTQNSRRIEENSRRIDELRWDYMNGVFNMSLLVAWGCTAAFFLSWWNKERSKAAWQRSRDGVAGLQCTDDCAGAGSTTS